MKQQTNDLLPCICQNFITGKVLMLGYMNEEAAAKTVQDKVVTFYSRSKERLWTKGESSGNYLELVSLTRDCDDDAILCQVIPRGPTCHSGTESCFAEGSNTFIDTLVNTIDMRRKGDDPDSYVATLVKSGHERIAQKVGEEGVEVALAAVLEKNLVEEAADLFFHLIVLLRVKNLSISGLFRELYVRSR